MSVPTAERFPGDDPMDPGFVADDTGRLRFEPNRTRRLADLAWLGTSRESEHPDGVPEFEEWWNTMPLDARGDLPGPYNQMIDSREPWEKNGAATAHFDDDPKDPPVN